MRLIHQSTALPRRFALALLLLFGSCGGSGNECPVCMEEKCDDLMRVCEEDADCACMAE
jgi:hypothetical protein